VCNRTRRGEKWAQRSWRRLKGPRAKRAPPPRHVASNCRPDPGPGPWTQLSTASCYLCSCSSPPASCWGGCCCCCCSGAPGGGCGVGAWSGCCRPPADFARCAGPAPPSRPAGDASAPLLLALGPPRPLLLPLLLLLVVGPLAVGPLAVGPLAVGPLAVGPPPPPLSPPPPLLSLLLLLLLRPPLSSPLALVLLGEAEPPGAAGCSAAAAAGASASAARGAACTAAGLSATLRLRLRLAAATIRAVLLFFVSSAPTESIATATQGSMSGLPAHITSWCTAAAARQHAATQAVCPQAPGLPHAACSTCCLSHAGRQQPQEDGLTNHAWLEGSVRRRRQLTQAQPFQLVPLKVLGCVSVPHLRHTQRCGCAQRAQRAQRIRE
jgi:hypothetical protein